MKVSNILEVKGNDVFTMRPEETIATLSHRLRALRVGAIIVSSDGNAVDAIFPSWKTESWSVSSVSGTL